MLNTKIKQSGFTIVELLIVIVVIAILAAISIVAYNGIQGRARDSSADTVAASLSKKAKAYYTINSAYPTTVAQFNDTNSKEANLEGIKVTTATGAAPTTVASATFGTTSTAPTPATALSEWQSGNRVIYSGTATGYSITTVNASGAAETISEGTAPTGTYTWTASVN